MIICSRNQRIASHKKKREGKLKEVESSFELRNQSQRGEVRADVKNLSQSFGQSRVARVLPVLPELPVLAELPELAVLEVLPELGAAGNQLATHFPSQCSCPPASEGGFTPRISSNWQRGCFTSTETVCTRVAWKGGGASLIRELLTRPETTCHTAQHNTAQHTTIQIQQNTAQHNYRHCRDNPPQSTTVFLSLMLHPEM